MPIHHQIRTVATTLATITIAALMLTGCHAAVRRNSVDEVPRKLITVWGAEHYEIGRASCRERV